jgi:LemA protein
MGRTLLIVLGVVAAIVVCGALLVIPAYGNMVTLDEQVNESWSQVENVYQRQAELIPNLVATVKGAAGFEQDTLTAVVEARAKATQPVIMVDGSPTAEGLREFQANQDALTSALSRLLVVAEAYPTLTATQGFRDLQGQLEGAQNRITNERRRYNETVRSYNTARRGFPVVLIAGLMGFPDRPYFEATPGSEQPPTVDFSTPVPATQP